MIATFFAFALAAAPAPDAGGCALQAPEACSDVGALVRDPQFQAELKAYVGTRNTSYLGDNGKAGDEALAVLGGPVQPAGRIGGFFLLTGCRTDACDEAGAVVLEPDGQFAAVAILHTNCAAFGRAKDCFLRETLSVFTDKDDPDEGVVNGLTDWARRQIQTNAQSPGAPITHLEKVDLIAAASKAVTPARPPKIDRTQPAPGPKTRPAPPAPVTPPSELKPEPAPPPEFKLTPEPQPAPRPRVQPPQPAAPPPSRAFSEQPPTPSVETPAPAPSKPQPVPEPTKVPPKAEPAPEPSTAKPAPKARPAPPPAPEPQPAPEPPPKPSGPTSLSGVDVLVRPKARIIVQPAEPVLPPTPVLEKPPKIKKRNFHPWLFRWNRGN